MRRNRRNQKKRIGGAALAVVVAAAGCTLIYWNLPASKADRKLDKATEYLKTMDYVQAEEIFSEALAIDGDSVRAYRGLADDYLAQGRYEDAVKMLKTGYETTGEEVLLQNYTATVLNEVVNHINQGTADFKTIGICLDLLEEAPENEKARELLLTCAKRVISGENESRILLNSMDGAEHFSEYRELMDRMLALADKNPAVFLPAARELLYLDNDEIYLSLSHADDYSQLLQKAQKLGADKTEGLIACLDKEKEISAYFAPVFAEFEAENYKAVKNVIVSEEYTAMRDSFIDGTMELWYGETFIPVTKEAIRLFIHDGSWAFSYLEDDSLAKPTGTIRILGEKMRDLGVQRSSIEYVPPYDPANYYPHTEYEIVYWNTMVSGIATDNTNVVSRMNYRFAEKIYNPQGVEANMIYDWGGPEEKRQKE